MRQHSPAGGKSDKTPLDTEVIPGLSALKQAVESAIPKTIAAILDQKLTHDQASQAAWRIHRMAVVLVSALGSLAKEKPLLLRAIAETSEAWPGFISPHLDYAKSNLELIERIGVGEKHFLRLKFAKGKRGKRWSARTPVNYIAAQLIKKLAVLQCVYRSQERDLRDKELREIEKKYGLEKPKPVKPRHSKKLRSQILGMPAISSDTNDRWFDTAWSLVLEETHGHPEWNPILRPLGAFRERHTKTASPVSKTSDTNVRDGIKQRLRAAFSEIIAEKT